MDDSEGQGLHTRPTVIWLLAVIAVAVGVGAIVGQVAALITAGLIIVAGILCLLGFRGRGWKRALWYSTAAVLLVAAAGVAADPGVLGIAGTSTNETSTVLQPMVGAASTAGPSATDPALGPLVTKTSWPLSAGCDGGTEVAVPLGAGQPPDFHSPKDIRQTLIDDGHGGAWTRGELTIKMSTRNGETVHLENVVPHVVPHELDSPAWIYDPAGGCGGAAARRFNFIVDSTPESPNQFVDAGAQGGVDFSSFDGVATEKLGSDFVISGSDETSIVIDAYACRGNYEWTVELQYSVAGDPTPYHADLGNFDIYGFGKNTAVYSGMDRSTGKINATPHDATLTGNACTLPSALTSKRSVNITAPSYSDYVGSWAHLNNTLTVNEDGSGTVMMEQSGGSSYVSYPLRFIPNEDGTLSGQVTGVGDAHGDYSDVRQVGYVFKFRFEAGDDGPVVVSQNPLGDSYGDMYWCGRNAWDHRCGQ